VVDDTNDPEHEAYKNLDPSSVERILNEIVLSQPNILFSDIGTWQRIYTSLHMPNSGNGSS
jgi:hypothetical protein